MPDEQVDNRNNRDVSGKFMPGHSGNPGGRPKGAVGLTARIRNLLQQTTNDGKQVADVLAEVMVREALKNPSKMWSFIKEFLERDEGKVSDKVEISGSPQTLVEMIEALEGLEKKNKTDEAPNRN